MTQTFKHKLPLIESNQALKHVIHNEALSALDALVFLRFSAMDVNDPPASPVEGDCLAIGNAPTGDFAPHAGKIAFYDANGWHYYTATDGMLAWDGSTQKLMVYASGVWDPLDQAPSLMQNAELLGVKTEADTTNRLAVKSDAALFSHADAGSDVRVKLNKASASATASFLFQSAWSGRAEVGLAGDDDLAIKVSPDGATWHNAMSIDRQTGHVVINKGVGAASVGLANKINLLPNAGRLALEKTRSVSTFDLPNGIVAENGASIIAHAKFHTDSVDYGGAGAANDADVKALTDMLKTASAAQKWPEFWVASCAAGGGTNHLHSASGSNKYRVLTSDIATANHTSSSIYVRVKTGSVLVDGDLHDVWVNGAKVSGYSTLTTLDDWVHINALAKGLANEMNNWPDGVFSIFANSGDNFLFALPAILPDAVRVPVDQGLVPSVV